MPLYPPPRASGLCGTHHPPALPAGECWDMDNHALPPTSQLDSALGTCGSGGAGPRQGCLHPCAALGARVRDEHESWGAAPKNSGCLTLQTWLGGTGEAVLCGQGVEGRSVFQSKLHYNSKSRNNSRDLQHILL